MSGTAPKRRGRPKKVVPEEERIDRERALQRARSQRYYARKHQQGVQLHDAPNEPQQTQFIHHHQYQTHSTAPLSTDPIVRLDPEAPVHEPIPAEDPLPVESPLNHNSEPSEAEAGSIRGPYNPSPVGGGRPHDTPLRDFSVIEEQCQDVQGL